jgi:hypothetical protein
MILSFNEVENAAFCCRNMDRATINVFSIKQRKEVDEGDDVVESSDSTSFKV